MTSDHNKGIKKITYNHLNQPAEVDFGTKKTVYTYTATGGMLKTAIYENGNLKSTTEYCGAFVYENDTLAYINIPGGRIIASTNEYQYNLTDHLGNVRVTFKDSSGTAVIIQEDHYYPFGMRMSGAHYSNTELLNKFLYNGKELQEQTGMYDYGFRQLDPQLGRWHVIDAMAEKYMSTSPYAYVENDPINQRDYLGLWKFRVYFDGIFGGYMSGEGNSWAGSSYSGTIPGGANGEYAQIMGEAFGGHFESYTTISIKHGGWSPRSAGRLGARGFVHWMFNHWSIESHTSGVWIPNNDGGDDDDGIYYNNSSFAGLYSLKNREK